MVDGMPGTAAPWPECPERLRLMRNARIARNGCALAGAAAPDAEWPERDDAG